MSKTSAAEAKGSDKEAQEAKETLDLVNRALALLRDGKPARFVERKPEEEKAFHMLGLLTSMPVLYVCNVDEASAATGNEFSRKVEARARAEGAACVVIAAKIEAEIAVLPPHERDEYLAAIGLEEAGLDRLIRAGYALLNLITYFTAGPKEAAAWTVARGTRAPQAAAVIHTDFERGFIRAETITYDDYVTYGGEAGAREAGKMRLEGKNYVVADGDVMHFRFATWRRDGRQRTEDSRAATLFCPLSSVCRPFSHLSAIANGAEVLVHPEHDQDELADDARKNDPDHHADKACQQGDEACDRAHGHQGDRRRKTGQPEQHGDADCEPVEDLDDRGGDEPFPLEQVVEVEHSVLLSTKTRPARHADMRPAVGERTVHRAGPDGQSMR